MLQGNSRDEDYLNHLNRLSLKDKQLERLKDVYGFTNAKRMVETVFGISPFILINTQKDEKENSSAM